MWFQKTLWAMFSLLRRWQKKLWAMPIQLMRISKDTLTGNRNLNQTNDFLNQFMSLGQGSSNMKMCNPPPLVSITTLQECMFGADIVQEANMQNRGNDANQCRRKQWLSIIDIGKEIGDWLLQTGQWPAFNNVDKPEDAHLSYASPCSEGSGARYFPPLVTARN